MAEAHHVKLSRKALREPDEFQALTAQAADWLRENRPAVVAALSVLAAIAVAVLGYNWYVTRQADAAAAQFGAAYGAFEGKRYDQAASEFAAVADRYPGTPRGKLAALYRAHALARSADPKSAAAAYTEYLASSPPTEYLRQEALLGLGRAQEAAGDAPAALDAYRQAAELAGPFRTPAQRAEARLEEAAGNVDKAKALYAEILKAPDLDPEAREEVGAHAPHAAPPADAAAAAD